MCVWGGGGRGGRERNVAAELLKYVKWLCVLLVLLNEFLIYQILNWQIQRCVLKFCQFAYLH